MTDVPEHTAACCHAAAARGREFMHIGCNGMSGSPQVPPLYWWEGPDGSRVLTMYSPEYGTGLIPPQIGRIKTWLAMLHTGDNHGPPRPEEVKKRAGSGAAKDCRASRCASAGCRISPTPSWRRSPICRSCAATCRTRGSTGRCRTRRARSMARNTRPLIAATEALNTQVRAWGVAVPTRRPRSRRPTSRACFTASTPGAARSAGFSNRFAFGEDFEKERAAGRFARIEGSWDEHTAYISRPRD